MSKGKLKEASDLLDEASDTAHGCANNSCGCGCLLIVLSFLASLLLI